LEEVQVVLQAAPGNLEAWLLKSQLLNAANDYPGAAAAYERVLALNPQSGVALNNLACLDSEHLGQLDKAYELAKKARLLQPFDPATADTLGWVLFHKKDYAAARALLQESAARLPRDAAVQLHFGRAAYMQGQEKAATAALQEALRLNPAVEGHEAGRRCLDLLALRVDPVGASPAARATLEKRIAETPDDPVALARLTVLYEQSGETDQAVRAGETLLKVNPDNVKVMLDLARLYEPNLVAKAFEMAKSAYKTAPRDPDTAYLLGRLAGQMQDYKWALSLLKEAAGNQPGNPGIRFDLARAAYRLGKVSEARTAYQSALDLGLTAPRAEQARQALKLIATAESPALIRTAGPDSAAILKTDPDLMVAALVWEQKTNLAAAGQNYEKVLKLHPDFTAAQKNLAGIYARDPQRIQDASALALKAHQASPEDAELTGMLGALLCQQGDYPAAVNHLTRAVSDRPNDPELYYYLGLAQFHLKESAQSKTALRHALELNLSGPPATEARRLLGQMR
jgi:tetratricopeptide (TPR) repeat protein